MNRRLALAAGAVVGFLAGVIVVSALRTGTETDAGTEDTTPPADMVSVTVPATTTAPVAVSSIPADSPAETERVSDDLLLIWTSGGLAPDLGAQVADLPQTENVSVVRAAELALERVTGPDGVVTETYDDGWNVPIDALALDPVRHAPFASPSAAEQLDALAPGRGLLSATGAALRGGGVGTVLEFSTGAVEIVGLIDDASASGAELIVDLATGESLGVVQDRFLLVAHDGDRAGLQAATVNALAAAGAPAPVRFRSPAETTWMRHGDAVLPLAQVKLHYGEFAIRDGSGRTVEIDPTWVAENIVDVDVPVLGTVRCHRLVIDQLESALRELVDRAITQVVDVRQFSGCHNARRIGVGLPLSRHSWGIALDLNVGDNPRGSFTTQDPRLVDVMRTAGFGWGGSWLVPDPAHYEIIEPRDAP